MPKDKNGNYLEHHQIHAYEQATAFKHFYKNYAKKHDRVSTIDCDEFYYSEKYDNIKNINGICFTQRYRTKDEDDIQFINEANLMVGSVAKCMEALIKFNDNKIASNENFTRVI